MTQPKRTPHTLIDPKSPNQIGDARARYSKLRHRLSAGFTLAEVTIAVLVLSSAVVVMIGLQSASVDNAFRAERKQKALMAARSILAALEIQTDPPEDIDVQTTLVDLISRREPLNQLDDWGTMRDLAPFQVHLQIAPWSIPLKGLPPDMMKVVKLRVFWNDAVSDSIELVYFIPKKA